MRVVVNFKETSTQQVQLNQNNIRISELEGVVSSLEQKISEHEHGSSKASELHNELQQSLAKSMELHTSVQELTLHRDSYKEKVELLEQENKELKLEKEASQKVIDYRGFIFVRSWNP